MRVAFRRTGLFSHVLSTEQLLRLPLRPVFSFFESPGNLFDITPDWLDFRMRPGSRRELYQGAEFDYTIRWLGRKLPWRSRITDYRPPRRFTDVQLAGPFARWVHRHTFEEVPGGTLMRDEVAYTLPFAGAFIHRLLLKVQLEDIFRYRGARVDRWSRGEDIRKTRRPQARR